MSFLVCASVLMGCESKHQASILLLAVDHLGPQAIDCNDLNRQDRSDKHDAQYRSGFQQLCSSFIRYSRVYSTSTQTVPALSSLLTGAYPVGTGMHDNYGDFLSPQFETLAKLASKKKWTTYFSSGGSPVLRRTGLGIGFQVFDDAIRPSVELIHRPAAVSFENYLRFVSDAPTSSTFSVLYLPDLLYIKTKTQNSLGEERGLSFDSQLENLDDHLGKFFQKLKGENRWDSTMVIVVGLNNSPTASHANSESAKVALFIKPMEGYPNLESLKANHDSVVSLSDLAATLYSALGSFVTPSESSLLKTFPLERLNSTNSENRWIAIESPSATDKDKFRWSVLNSRASCIGGERTQCFASSQDMNEGVALTGSDLKLAQTPAEPILAEIKSRVDAHEFHSATTPTSANGSFEKCFELIKNRSSLADLRRDCTDSEVLDFVSWVQIDSDQTAEYNKRETARRRFQKDYGFHELDKVIENTNKELGYIWPQKSSVRFMLIEALLDSPQYAKYRSILVHNSASQ